MLTTATSSRPVVIIGAGPIGLAAAAQLSERGLSFVVLEAGSTAAAAISDWGHTRLFSPWQYNLDAAAQRLLEASGWIAPESDALPTGHELREQYLEPLAQLPQLAESIRYNARVTAVSRAGMDKTRTARREETPFLVRIETADGHNEDVLASAVIDASGTWSAPNPLGQAGLLAPGEQQALTAGHITPPLPDVQGRDRDRFTGRRVMVMPDTRPPTPCWTSQNWTLPPRSSGPSAPRTSLASTGAVTRTSSQRGERSAPDCAGWSIPDASRSSPPSPSPASTSATR